MTAEPFPGGPVVSFHGLFDERGVRPRDQGAWRAVWDAEVVTAVDVTTGRESVVFGRRVLASIGGSDGRRVDVLRVGLDLDADELPLLRAAVAAAKSGG